MEITREFIREKIDLYEERRDAALRSGDSTNYMYYTGKLDAMVSLNKELGSEYEYM